MFKRVVSVILVMWVYGKTPFLANSVCCIGKKRRIRFVKPNLLTYLLIYFSQFIIFPPYKLGKKFKNYEWIFRPLTIVAEGLFGGRGQLSLERYMFRSSLLI